MNNLSEKTVHISKLSYKGDHGIILIKSIKTSSKKALPKKQDARIISTDTKLSFHFNIIRDDTNKQRKHDLVYFSRCPSTIFVDSHIGETSKRQSKHVLDHASRDTK